MKPLQRVICADDEPDMRMLIKLSLENVGGYEVKIFGSGRELLDEIDRWNPDLIILDAMMPGMDGLCTMENLRCNPKFKGTPVLFMTGKAKEAGAEFLAAGAQGVVSKPFDPVHLAADIGKIWESIQNG